MANCYPPWGCNEFESEEGGTNANFCRHVGGVDDLARGCHFQKI